MILVTGATGHIGNVLIRQLQQKGANVRALLLPGEDHRSLDGLEVDLVEGNITQPATLKAAMEGVQMVYHLAGMISILPGRNELLHQVNVQGTINVIRSCWQAGVQRLVYTSSIHAIAPMPHGITIDETAPFDPESLSDEYSRSKAEATLAVIDAAQQGLNAVIICPTGVIGPYDYRRSELGQIFLDCIEEKPQLYVDGAYDFVDVRDVAAGLILASEKGRAGETYILSGERISVESLLSTIQKITDLHFSTFRLPMALARFVAQFTPAYYRLARTKPRFTSLSLEVLESNSMISHAKAQQELGYQPRALKETLADTVNWFRENRHLLAASTVR